MKCGLLCRTEVISTVTRLSITAVYPNYGRVTLTVISHLSKSQCACYSSRSQDSRKPDHEDSLKDLLGYGLIYHQIVREMRGEDDGI